ncbi:unnamed protein product [Rotaria sp. Silwood2]|nr:unnamed protein product [Rotaria sp. Silwood2]
MAWYLPTNRMIIFRVEILPIERSSCIRQKQAKTIAIQRRINNLGQRYYDGAISAMEYLNGLSFTVAKQKK